MGAVHLGFFNTATTRTHVGFQFSTHNAAGANVAPSSSIDAADIRIYKATDGAAFSATQRSSAAGITVTSPFDSLTGFHDVDIDLTDNTDSGFYASGSRYTVVLAPNDETIDSQVLTGVVLAYFEIGVAKADVIQWLGTAAAAPTVAGVPEVDVTHWIGTAAATPTVAGVPEVDVTHFDGVSLSTPGPIPKLGIVDFGTAQSASGTGLVLRSAAAFADDTLIGCTVFVLGSTQGYWQERAITDNALSGDTVTVDAWTVTPSGTITYVIFGGAPATAPTAAQIRAEIDSNSTQLAAMIARQVPLSVTTGAVTTDAGNSATAFETDLTQTTNDYWNDAFLLITSGVLAGQVKKVSAYNGTTKFITVSGGFTGTPADGVSFAIVNR